MNSVAVRLAAFAVALIVAFSGAYVAGAAIGPFEDGADDPPAASHGSDASEHGR